MHIYDLTQRPWGARKGLELCGRRQRMCSHESSLYDRASAKKVMQHASYPNSCLVLILAQRWNWLINAILLIVA